MYSLTFRASTFAFFYVTGAVASANEAALCPPDSADFVRGNADRSGRLDLADVYHLVRSFEEGAGLPGGTPPFFCPAAADVNDDNRLVLRSTTAGGDINPFAFDSDVDHLVDFMLSHSPELPGPTLPEPYPTPGQDNELVCGEERALPPFNGRFGEGFDWETILGFEAGAEIDMYQVLRADDVAGFSLVYLVDTRYIEILSVDFEGTAVQERLGLDFDLTQTRYFDYRLSAPFDKQKGIFAGGDFQLLSVISLFYTEGLVGLATRRLVSVPLDAGSFDNDRLLHIRARVKPDFPPLTSETVILEPFVDSYAGDLGDLGGLRNAAMNRIGGHFDFTSSGRVDPGKIFAGGFLRSDSNEDSVVDITDQVNAVSFLFKGTYQSRCLDAMDINDDGKLDIIDPLFGLNHLFNGGPPIPEPSTECDEDQTPDVNEFGVERDLGCIFYCPERCDDPPSFCIEPSFGF